MNPTSFILISCVLLVAIQDSSGNPAPGMKGTLPGQHYLMQVGNLQEEVWIEELQSQDLLEWNTSTIEPAGKSIPENSINHLSGTETIRVSQLDPVLLDRPPPPPGIF